MTKNVDKGILVGVANVGFVAGGVAVMAELGHDFGGGPLGATPGAGLFIVVVMACIVPSIGIGMAVGKLADMTAGHHPFRRWLALSMLGCAGVFALGALGRWLEAIPFGCLATLVSASVLERWTRAPEAIPRAACVPSRTEYDPSVPR